MREWLPQTKKEWEFILWVTLAAFGIGLTIFNFLCTFFGD